MKRLLATILLGVGTCITTACPPANANPNHYVQMKWEGKGPFVVYRNVNSSAFTVVGQTNLTTWQDNSVTPNKRYCYYIMNSGGASGVKCATIPSTSVERVVR